MAAPFLSTPFQPFVYQSPEAAFIPFQILGGEAQIVQIMLKSQESITAKPGSMCYMSGSIQMENIYVPENGGMWQWLFGRSMTSIALLNPGPHDGFVGIAAPSLARIIPIDLATFGGEILCQPDAFLCSVNDVTITSTVDQRARNVMASGEGILKQKLVGRGLAFLVAGGSVVQKNLDVGEVLVVDASCIVAMTGTIDFQVKYSGPMRRVVFGGDNLLTAVLTGPGIVFVQSLPFHRFSQRVARQVFLFLFLFCSIYQVSKMQCLTQESRWYPWIFSLCKRGLLGLKQAMMGLTVHGPDDKKFPRFEDCSG